LGDVVRDSRDDDAAKVERMFARKRAEVVDRTPDIEIGARPAAARLSDSAVLNVPGCDPRVLQRVAHRRQIAHGRICRFETAAVDEHHDRMRALTRRHAQLSVLTGVVAVRDSSVRLAAGEGLQGPWGHQAAGSRCGIRPRRRCPRARSGQ
jgi:hypothetical protein